MKAKFAVLVISTFLTFMSTSAFAYSIQLASGSGDWLTSIGGFNILEYMDADATASTGNPLSSPGPALDWNISGTGTYGGSGPQLWLLGGDVAASTTFTVASNAVSFMLLGDENDGLADFFVDGVLVADDYDTYSVGYNSLIVTGLDYSVHTLEVVHLNAKRNASTNTHIALFGGAALDVPEPSTLALMSLGLTGFGFSRRRKWL